MTDATHRRILPNRRPSITLEAQWSDHPIIVTVGLDPVSGLPMEIFGDMEKGGDLAAVCRDAAVALSLALQHGATPADLDKTMTRIPAWVNGEEGLAYASPVGAIVGALVGVGD